MHEDGAEQSFAGSRDGAPGVPSVSIGLPVYNGAEYLRRAFETLLAQSFADFELIVSDNGSTDETPQICREYAARDHRVRYERVPVNRGASWNFNRVVELARAENFMWAAHDDEWDPVFLERCLDVLRERPSVVACYSRYQLVNDRGEDHGEAGGIGCEGASRQDRWQQVLRDWLIHAAVYGVMRTKAVRSTRGFLACVSSDLIFMAELILQGELVVLPEVLHRKRLPRGNRYRSHQEILASLGSQRKTPWLFHRYRVLREELVGLRHAALPMAEERELSRQAWRHYVLSRSWLHDGIESARDLANGERGEWVRSRIASLTDVVKHRVLERRS